MKRHQSSRPGLGLLIALSTYLLLGGLWGWAWSRPALDHLWQILHQVRVGAFETLTPADWQHFNRSLQSYPDLAINLTEGAPFELLSPQRSGWTTGEHAVGIRTSALQQLQFKLSATGQITVAGWPSREHPQGWQRVLQLRANQPQWVSLPTSGSQGELLEITLQPATLRAQINLPTEGVQP